MDDIKIIHLDETDSTNRFLRDYRGEDGGVMTVAVADYQRAGRGQGTNSWESERGKNLTFSLKCRPVGVPVARQYSMLEAGALAVAEALSVYASDFTIKWPNDVYWRDYKISGTLSECTVCGQRIKDCILGVGINVNQQTFLSDAPNPVSLFNVTGKETDRKELLDKVLAAFLRYKETIDGGELDTVHREYMSRLYRGQGAHRFSDCQGDFCATIDHIAPNGHLVLRREDGRMSEYAFKEVIYK